MANNNLFAILDTRDGSTSHVSLITDDAEGYVAFENKRIGADVLQSIPTEPEVLRDHAQGKIDGATKTAVHLLGVLLDPEADYDRIRRSGMSAARRHNAASWAADCKKRAAEALAAIKQAGREKSAALLAICLRDNAAEISHVTTRRLSEMGDRVLLVYKRDSKSPTGCCGTFGSFEVCPETDAVLIAREEAATPGGRRGNMPNSTVGY